MSGTQLQELINRTDRHFAAEKSGNIRRRLNIKLGQLYKLQLCHDGKPSVLYRFVAADDEEAKHITSGILDLWGKEMTSVAFIKNGGGLLMCGGRQVFPPLAK